MEGKGSRPACTARRARPGAVPRRGPQGEPQRRPAAAEPRARPGGLEAPQGPEGEAAALETARGHTAGGGRIMGRNPSLGGCGGPGTGCPPSQGTTYLSNLPACFPYACLH